MRKTIKFRANGKEIEREYFYIPVRFIIAMLLLILEVVTIIGIVIALCYYVPYFYMLAWLTQIACVITIVASDDNPDYKVPWLLVVLIIPVAGFMLYFLFYSRKLKKKYVKRLKDLKDHNYGKDDSVLFTSLQEASPQAAAQAKMLCNIAETHLFTNTKQTYFPLGEDMFRSLVDDLQRAEKFIYMEYFIIEEGKFWNTILEILKYSI